MEKNTMKIRTRMLTLVLVLSFLLGLCGCLPVPTVRKGETAPEDELQTSEAGLPARGVAGGRRLFHAAGARSAFL